MHTAELIALPLPQRLHAMELLWNSLTHSNDTQPIAPDWHKQVVLARVKKLRAGETTRSLEQTKLSIQKRIKLAQR
jgi:hypothetical protein